MPTTPTIDPQELAANYGWALSVLKSNPELNKLFNQAVAHTWSPAMFTAQLRNTKWYKTSAEASRQNQVLRKADPAEWARRLAKSTATISDQYFALTGKKLDPKRAQAYGTSSLMMGWSDAEILDQVGNTVTAQTLMKQGLGGTLGQAEQQLRQAAEDYGLDFSQGALASQLNNIARQTTDVTAIIDNYRNTAKSKYAAYADQLDQGMTMRDIAEPYKQMMAKTLELSDKSLTINNPAIQQALTWKPPPKAGKAQPPTGMALWQFEQNLKNDPRWNKTQNAQDSIMAAGRKVLSDMGLLGADGG